MFKPQYCPLCGKPRENGDKICSGCGFDLDSINLNERNTCLVRLETPSAATAIKRFMSKLNIRLVCFSVIALSVLIISFIAASKISDGAYKIMQIRSSSGNTINEVYFRDMGPVYSGYAMFIRECGVFFAAVLVGLGLKKSGH
jgi:hypothetical protein